MTWGPTCGVRRTCATSSCPSFRLTGWTPDWYAGFPAYTFYMVVPVAADRVARRGPAPLCSACRSRRPCSAGPGGCSVGPAPTWASSITWVGRGVFLAVPAASDSLQRRVQDGRRVGTGHPAGRRLGPRAGGPGSRSPVPPLLAIGATCFLFENGFSILGGNILSTMAGEFAFSISLTFAMLYLADAAPGHATPAGHRALGAVLFGLTILNHLIPAIFVVVATVVIVLLRREDRTPWWDRDHRGPRGSAPALVGLVSWSLWLVPDGLPDRGHRRRGGALLVGLDRRAFRWAGVVAARSASCWPRSGSCPFYLNSAFLNDMGWEKYTELRPTTSGPDRAVRHGRTATSWFALAGVGHRAVAGAPGAPRLVPDPDPGGLRLAVRVPASVPAVERPPAAVLLPVPVPAGAIWAWRW